MSTAEPAGPAEPKEPKEPEKPEEQTEQSWKGPLHMSETPLLERLADAVADTSAPMDATDRVALAELLPLIEQYAADEELPVDRDRMLAVAVHALAFARRVRSGERLEELGAEVYAEVPPERLASTRRLVDAFAGPRAYAAPESEVLLFALHFEVARHQVPARERDGD